MNARRSSSTFTPALGRPSLTRFYDPILGLTLREQYFKTRLIEQANIVAGQRILDLGCGTGTLLMLTKKLHPDTALTGVDADDRVLELAVAKAARSGLEIEFNRGASDHLHYRNAQFDRVLSSLFLHHISSRAKERTLEEVFRVLRPGGEIHVADWGRPSNRWMRLLFLSVRMLDGFESTADNVHGRIPDLFAAAGFQDVEVGREIPTVCGTLALYSARKPDLIRR